MMCPRRGSLWRPMLAVAAVADPSDATLDPFRTYTLSLLSSPAGSQAFSLVALMVQVFDFFLAQRVNYATSVRRQPSPTALLLGEASRLPRQYSSLYHLGPCTYCPFAWLVAPASAHKKEMDIAAEAPKAAHL